MILSTTSSIQKVRPNTNWETYRIGLPKSMVKALNLEEGKLLIELRDKMITISKAPKQYQKS